MNNEYAARLKILYDELASQKQDLLHLTKRYVETNQKYNALIVDAQKSSAPNGYNERIAFLEASLETEKRNKEYWHKEALKYQDQQHAIARENVEFANKFKRLNNDYSKQALKLEEMRNHCNELMDQRVALSASNAKLQDEVNQLSKRRIW